MHCSYVTVYFLPHNLYTVIVLISCKISYLELYIANVSVETSSLAAFPRVAAAFCRYNAALPSSAAVERLFSAAGQILTPRRCKMSDTNFEQAVFLRYRLREGDIL